jgi:hypothetical protein
MVARVAAGNILREATPPSGNIFNEAMRSSRCSQRFRLFLARLQID